MQSFEDLIHTVIKVLRAAGPHENSDDTWHMRLYHSNTIVTYMSEYSVQCANGTRNSEMTVTLQWP